MTPSFFILQLSVLDVYYLPSTKKNLHFPIKNLRSYSRLEKEKSRCQNDMKWISFSFPTEEQDLKSKESITKVQPIEPFQIPVAKVDKVDTSLALSSKKSKESKVKTLNSILLQKKGHVGHLTFRWNPKMLQHIYKPVVIRGQRRHILNTVKTSKKLIKTARFLKNIASKGGMFLFVGTKLGIADLIKQKSKKCESFFITNSWLGGILTNWDTMKVSIQELTFSPKNIKSKAEAKKARRLFNLKKKIEGLKGMMTLPNVVIITGARQEKKAIAECRKLGIPIVSTLDTNSNPTGIRFPLPVNEDSYETVKFILNLLINSIRDGRFSKQKGENFKKKSKK